jgi:hypothetical protein
MVVEEEHPELIILVQVQDVLLFSEVPIQLLLLMN